MYYKNFCLRNDKKHHKELITTHKYLHKSLTFYKMQQNKNILT